MQHKYFINQYMHNIHTIKLFWVIRLDTIGTIYFTLQPRNNRDFEGLSIESK